MERPNIALIVLDSFRYDHLWRSVRGEPLCPHLSDFAEGATSFENAIAPAAFTGPTHVSLLTGRTPADHKLFTLAQLTGARLPAPHLVGLLQSRGYVCVAFTANPWISRSTALGRDFDILISAGALTRPAPFAVEEGMGRKLARRARALVRSFLPRSMRPTAGPSCAELLVQTERLLRSVPTVLRTLRAQWPTRPVFLFCNLMVTHDPYLFEPRDAGLARPEGMGGRIAPRRFQKDYWFDLLGVEPISEQQLARIRWAYAASVCLADRAAGRLVRAIDECLGAEDTDVVLTADHGECLGEYGVFDHGLFLYEPLVHVPLLVRSPALGVGLRVERPVQNHWAWSLLVERAGVSAEARAAPAQGSLTGPDASGPAGTPMHSFSHDGAAMERLAVALRVAAQFGVEAERVRPTALDGHLQAVRLGGRVLIQTCSGATKGFRIQEGPVEREVFGEDLEQLRLDLRPHLVAAKELAAGGPAGSGADVGDPVLGRLRDLGYVD